MMSLSTLMKIKKLISYEEFCLFVFKWNQVSLSSPSWIFIFREKRLEMFCTKSWVESMNETVSLFQKDENAGNLWSQRFISGLFSVRLPSDTIEIRGGSSGKKNYGVGSPLWWILKWTALKAKLSCCTFDILSFIFPVNVIVIYFI